MSRKTDLEKLFDELLDLGFTIKVTSKGHYMVKDPNGMPVYTLAGTGGRGRGDANARAVIQRHMRTWRTKQAGQ